MPVWLNAQVPLYFEMLKEQIIDRNVEQMEIRGERADGSKFGDYAAASYDIGYPQMKMAEQLPQWKHSFQSAFP